MAIVRENTYGLYIKAGGYVFRPVFPIGYAHVHADLTEFKVGDSLRARHKGGTPLATLKNEVREEVWFSHGDYGPERPSDVCFKPSYEQWPNR